MHKRRTCLTIYYRDILYNYATYDWEEAFKFMTSVRFEEYISVGTGHMDASIDRMEVFGMWTRYPIPTHKLHARPTITPEMAPCYGNTNRCFVTKILPSVEIKSYLFLHMLC